MRVSNPLANSYTKNQADNQFLTVDTSGSESGTPNPINADTLEGHPASYFAQDSEVVKSVNNNSPVDGNVTIDLPFIQMTLLWTNDTPTSTFNSQTIQLELSDYNYVLIRFYSSSANEKICPPLFIKNGENGVLLGTLANNRYRYCNLTNSGIVFEDGYVGTSTDNSMCVPLDIYGVKVIL